MSKRVTVIAIAALVTLAFASAVYIAVPRNETGSLGQNAPTLLDVIWPSRERAERALMAFERAEKEQQLARDKLEKHIEEERIAEKMVQAKLNDLLKDAPPVYGGKFKCAKMVNAVNALKKLGKKRCLAALRAYDADMRDDDSKIHLICRLLFVNPKGWKPPMLGGPVPDIKEEALKYFPLFPIAISDGVPFLMVQGYDIGGTPEPAMPCVDICSSLELVKDDYPLTGYEKAAQELTESDAFRKLYKTGDRSEMVKMVLNQAKEEPKRSDNRDPHLSVTLKLEGKADTFPKQKYVLTIKNVSENDVLLDRQLLNPVILVVILDEHGKEIGKIPPSVPRAFSDDDALALKPGKVVTVSFELSEVTMDALNGKKYELFCRYSSAGVRYPETVKMWRGVLETERISFGQK